MEFTIKNVQRSAQDMMRAIGYTPAYFQKEGELSMIRKLGGEYPRFHLYIVQQGHDMIFKLHLDQKKPSYEGATGHSGDYDGPAVENEAERIKSLLHA